MYFTNKNKLTLKQYQKDKAQLCVLSKILCVAISRVECKTSYYINFIDLWFHNFTCYTGNR